MLHTINRRLLLAKFEKYAEAFKYNSKSNVANGNQLKN